MDDGAVLRQDEIRFAREAAVFRTVHGEAVAEAVEQRAQGQLRFGVPAADAGHELGSFFRSKNIGHAGNKHRKPESET